MREDHSHGAYEHWPLTRADLDPHYDRAEAMLGATPYPLDRAPYDRTAKTVAFKAAAEAAGLDWQLPPLAVTFAPGPGEEPVPGEPIREARTNLHGRTAPDLPAVRRVRLRLQLRREEHARLHLPDGRLARRAPSCARAPRSAPSRPREGGGWTVDYVEHAEAAEGHKTDTKALPGSP